VGQETGVEPATTGITIPPQLRCLHPAKAARGVNFDLFSI